MFGQQQQQQKPAFGASPFGTPAASGFGAPATTGGFGGYVRTEGKARKAGEGTQAE